MHATPNITTTTTTTSHHHKQQQMMVKNDNTKGVVEGGGGGGVEMETEAKDGKGCCHHPGHSSTAPQHRPHAAPPTPPPAPSAWSTRVLWVAVGPSTAPDHLGTAGP